MCDVSTGCGDQNGVYKADGTIKLDISPIGYPFQMQTIIKLFLKEIIKE